MIGSHPAPVHYLRRSAHEDPAAETFRHELRRGWLSLAVMSALHAEQHGYALRSTLEKRGIRIEPGTLYPLLRRLEAQGVLSSQWRREGKRDKRFYRLTERGVGVREQLLAEWRGLDRSLSAMLRVTGDRAA